MYKKLLILTALYLITACAGNSINDDLLQDAEDNYTDAGTMISKARSYNLKVNDAENQLAKSAVLIKEEKYDASISSSKAARKFAADAISKYEQKQDELTQAKIKAAKLARAEEKWLAAEEAVKAEATTEYTVQVGDNLWSIAAANKQLDHKPLLWPLIFSDNQSVIDDPDYITPGMLLHINKVTDTNRLDNAQRHAQTRGNWRIGSREDTDQNYLQQ
jgi:nucleoid-associated protein YgaU